MALPFIPKNLFDLFIALIETKLATHLPICVLVFEVNSSEKKSVNGVFSHSISCSVSDKIFSENHRQRADQFSDQNDQPSWGTLDWGVLQGTFHCENWKSSQQTGTHADCSWASEGKGTRWVSSYPLDLSLGHPGTVCKKETSRLLNCPVLGLIGSCAKGDWLHTKLLGSVHAQPRWGPGFAASAVVRPVNTQAKGHVPNSLWPCWVELGVEAAVGAVARLLGLTFCITMGKLFSFLKIWIMRIVMAL